MMTTMPAAASEPRPPRLIAVDVDGTLLTSDHRVTAATRAAAARAHEQGVDLLVASSRGPRALLPVLDALGLRASTYFVASGGALLGRWPAGAGLEVVRQRPMPASAARAVLVEAEQVGLAVSWFSGADWYVSAVDSTVEREARVVGDRPSVRDLHADAPNPDKLMIIAPSDDDAPLRAVVRALPDGLLAQRSNPTYLEITRAGVDKADAVRYYCGLSGIAAADVVAIGDGANDLPLFAFAGRSIAPANARPDVLAAATWVTAGNDEDGVAVALERLLTLR
jgi:Cof subfamily protein (haloacid dehalogenase superfamily)